MGPGAPPSGELPPTPAPDPAPVLPCPPLAAPAPAMTPLQEGGSGCGFRQWPPPICPESRLHAHTLAAVVSTAARHRILLTVSPKPIRPKLGRHSTCHQA